MGGLKLPPRRGWTLNSGAITIIHAGDDADYLGGLAKPNAVYVVSGAGTTIINSPHYAANTISFDNASKKILDSANGLATLLAGDTIYIRNGANAGLSYLVDTGATAAFAVLHTAPITEAAGNYITVCKQAAWSNVVVRDLNTGLMWTQKTSAPYKYGPASDGKMYWYDATKAFVLHAAGADLQMIKASHILKIVGGAAEAPKFWVGAVILCAGFSNAGNNLPGRWITAVTVNGGDLDLTLASWGLISGVAARNTLVDEAAGGSRSIKVECQSVHVLAAAARVASLGGITDWRVPDVNDLFTLVGQENNGVPDPTAFPSWPTAAPIWTATFDKSQGTNIWGVRFSDGGVPAAAPTVAGYYGTLVRGGVPS